MPISNEEMPAKKLVLFFIVDTSYSMDGGKIGALNNAIEEVLPMLGDISKDNNDSVIEIAVLEFSSGAKWTFPTSIPAEDFTWKNLAVNGMTDLGDACKELKNKLSHKTGFMTNATGCFAPVCILLSDGGPTDSYEKPLADLHENKWFKHGVKIAIAIGNDANTDVLTEFTGNKEAVFTVHNIDALKKIIKCTAVTSSQVASQTTSSKDQTKTDEVIKVIKNETKDDEGITPADDPQSSGISMDDDWD
jgi:uncharacterized protein YegL